MRVPLYFRCLKKKRFGGFEVIFIVIYRFLCYFFIVCNHSYIPINLSIPKNNKQNMQPHYRNFGVPPTTGKAKAKQKIAGSGFEFSDKKRAPASKSPLISGL